MQELELRRKEVGGKRDARPHSTHSWRAALKDNSKVRVFFYEEEDGCICSVSKKKFCKKQNNLLLSAFLSLLPPVEGCRPQGRALSEPDIPKCLVPNFLDN